MTCNCGPAENAALEKMQGIIMGEFEPGSEFVENSECMPSENSLWKLKGKDGEDSDLPVKPKVCRANTVGQYLVPFRANSDVIYRLALMKY
jgi:hypothetical protein